MTTELLANNYTTTLSGNGGSINNSQQSFNIVGTLPAALQAAGQFRMIIDQEIMIVPGGQTGPALTGVTRGAETVQNGGPAAAHNDGAIVAHIFTAGQMASVAANVALLDNYYDSAAYADKAAAIQAAIDAVQAQANGGVLECASGRVYSGIVRGLRFARGKPCRIIANGCTFQADPTFSTATAKQLFGFKHVADYDTFTDIVIDGGATLDLQNISGLSGFASINGDSGAQRANFTRCGLGNDTKIINGSIAVGTVSAGFGLVSTHANGDFVPAGSPATFQNLAAGGFANVPLNVTVAGGTVSLIETSPTGAFAGEQTNVGFTSGTVTLTAAAYIRITYTVAPSVYTSEATQTLIQDCFVGERFSCSGCNSGIVAVGASKGTFTGAGSPANVVTLRLTVGKGWWTDQGLGTPQSGTGARGANIQLGSRGYVQDSTIGPGVGLNSSDEGIEIDNATNVEVDHPTIIDAANCACLDTAFIAKAMMPQQSAVRTTWIEPTVRFVQLYPKQSSGASLPFAIAGIGATGFGNIQAVSTVVYVQPRVEITAAWLLAATTNTISYANHGSFFFAQGAIDRVVIDALHVNVEAVNWTAGSTTQPSLIGMLLDLQTGGSVDVGHIHVTLNGTWNDDGSHSMTLIPVHVSGTSTSRVRIDGVTIRNNIVNAGTKPPTLQPVALGSSIPGGTLTYATGYVRNVKVRGDQHLKLAAVTGVQFGTATTVQRFLIENVDLSDAALGLNALAVSAPLPARVRVNNLFPRPAAYAAPTLSTGIDVVTNGDGTRDRMIVSGGTVTKLELVSATYLEAVLTLPGLLGYWEFADRSGTTAVEASGLTTAGTFGSAVTLRNAILAKQLRGAAPNFPGADVNSKVDLGSTFEFLGLAPFTVIAWVNPSSLAATGLVVTQLANPGSGNQGWALEVNTTGQVVLARFLNGSPSTTAGGALVVGTSYMIAGTYDGTTLKPYVNGALQGGGSLNSTSLVTGGSTHTWVGQIAVGGSRFAGNIAHVAILSGALTAAQLLSLYNAATTLDGNVGVTVGAVTAEPDEQLRVTNSAAPAVAVLPA